MSGFEAALLLGGSLLSAGGTAVSGLSASSAMKAEAAAQERQAGEVQAASQRDAIERRKEANLLLSRQQAVAASSGGTATDTGVLNLMADTAAQGDYNVATSIYEGNSAAAGLLDQAAISRMQAKQATMAGFINAGSTMLSGFSQYKKYRPPPSTGYGLPTYSSYVGAS